ncbi:hypothetical protein Nepgr_025034 [Nepenthes gracilis]|uniref:Uncharacterized protein n=1 Tax=Nepenthes gracilis TaxID=150966 RepID=A0AAD3Y131_NEPGR|nr:hypothetical protein Nepgr_025034 [Nepenthes gracilis]
MLESQSNLAATNPTPKIRHVARLPTILRPLDRCPASPATARLASSPSGRRQIDARPVWPLLDRCSASPTIANLVSGAQPFRLLPV